MVLTLNKQLLLSPIETAIEIKPPRRTYYPALDGLRGMAILLVVVYHNFGFIDYFFFGWLGVDLFFVLSGFLITRILMKSLGQKNYLGNFYMRRVLRIFPLYYASLIIFLLILPNFNTGLSLSYYTENQLWLWTYLQNWLFIFHDPGNTNTLNHLWSLAVEEQFYLLWPLVILLIRNPRTLLVIISLLLLSVIGLRLWIWNNQIVNLAYFNLYTFTRIDGICIGCIVALLQFINRGFLKKHTTWIVLVFAAINFIFFFFNRSYDFSFPYLALVGYTTFAMIFGLLVNEVISGDSSWLNRIFEISLLRFFGRISYGFYIFHWPVFLLLNTPLARLMDPWLEGVWLNISVAVLATAVAVAISWLSFRFFERYFLQMKKNYE